MSRKLIGLSSELSVIFIPGVMVFRYSPYSLNSSFVPGQTKKMSSRNLKNKIGFILNPCIAFWSKCNKYKLAKAGACFLPMAIPHVCLYHCPYISKSLFLRVISSRSSKCLSGLPCVGYFLKAFFYTCYCAMDIHIGI